MNRHSRRKATVFAVVTLIGSVLALPTLYGDDPAVYVTLEGIAADDRLRVIETSLEKAGLQPLGIELERAAAVVRFDEWDTQLEARDTLTQVLPRDAVALTFAPRMPAWLKALGVRPVNLGLDLRGGVYFLYDVDLEAAVEPLLESYRADLDQRLRAGRVRAGTRVQQGRIIVQVADPTDVASVRGILGELERDARNLAGVGPGASSPVRSSPAPGSATTFFVSLSEDIVRRRQDSALEQNVSTLRNRVDELGVAQPVVQRQGRNRISVELPGVQDPAQARMLLGVAATLEFRLVDPYNDARTTGGRPLLGSGLYYLRNGSPILLRNEVIASGEQLIDATAGYSEGEPAVFVTLDSTAARAMLDVTQRNLGRRLGVLFITQKPELAERDGEQVFVTNTREEVIVAPVIGTVLSNRFRITGLPPNEAQEIALLLRSGSLAAPMTPAGDGTIGPSLGRDNVEKGRLAIVAGFLAVTLFMAIYYRTFGLIANVALFANVALIVALLSLLPASLTLPGIAGIVLTVGMAVDANVLIFERIREERRRGSSMRAGIAAGYDRALSSILDANVTTLIAALVLLAFGTGPVKGFAVTLGIGIITSMFTALIGTRAMLDLLYDGAPAPIHARSANGP